MTQAELAKRAGMDAPLLNRYCNGKHRPSPETLEQICSVLLEDPDRVEVVIGHLRDETPASAKELIQIISIIESPRLREEVDPFRDVKLTEKDRKNFQQLMLGIDYNPGISGAIESLVNVLKGKNA